MISHGILFNFAPELYQICTFLAATKKLSIDLESLHFPMFLAKRREFKMERNGHGKVMEKCLVKSVGTL